MPSDKDFTIVGSGWVGPLPELLTVDELAQYLREHPNFTRKLLRMGEFPRAFRQGGRWKIPKQDVLDYVERRWGDTRTEKERYAQ